MKKTIVTAFVMAFFSGGVLASDNPQATFVFEGFIPSVTPSSSMTITGVGGAGAPSKGTLSVAKDGAVSTSVPIIFEVRSLGPSGTVGGLVPNYSVRYVSSALTAGSARVDNSTNIVALNDSAFTSIGEVKAVTGIAQSTVKFTNEAGFNSADVGAGEAVQASVVIMVESSGASAGS